MFVVDWNRWPCNFLLILVGGFLIELSCNLLDGFKISKTFSMLVCVCLEGFNLSLVPLESSSAM
jgi:hypothetical protein